MSSSLLLQQCSACLVRLTWIVFMMEGRWPYSWCLVGCCLQDLFNIARSILVKLPSSFFSSCLLASIQQYWYDHCLEETAFHLKEKIVCCTHRNFVFFRKYPLFKNLWWPKINALTESTSSIIPDIVDLLGLSSSGKLFQFYLNNSVNL